MQQCTDARPNCRSRHREPNGNRRETTRPRSDTIVDLRPTPRSLGGLSGYSTKPAGKEQAKTHEESAECLPSVRAADRRRRTLLENQKRRRASQNARYRDAASFKRTNPGKRPPEEKSEHKPNRNTHRQDRPPASLPLDAQGGTIRHSGGSRSLEGRGEHPHPSPLRLRKGPGGCTHSRKTHRQINNAYPSPFCVSKTLSLPLSEGK